MLTNNLLATGGMMQEGGTIDPISGNDVPIGSLKNEVRDDVDAKLSDGEFVFSADVTRYIGLDKLMQIRDAAKQGLQKMDSMGQMGNAEEVAGDSDDEDQFSSQIDDIIATVDGKEDVKKFAGGGGVNTTDYSGAPLSGFTMELYEDPKTKVTRYIPFLKGKPLLPIPAGYVKKVLNAPENVTDVTTTPTVTTTTDINATGKQGGRGAGTEDGGGSATRPVNDAGVEGFGDIQGGTNPNLAKIGGAVVGLFNPLLGLLVGAGGGYLTKINNEKMAAANAKAIDASALAAAGFDARDIKSAQEAAARATLDGKSAKEIAVITANAAATGATPNSPKTPLDALIGITNGFNTANKDVMKIPVEYRDKVPADLYDKLINLVASGVPVEKAAQQIVDSAGGKAAAAGLGGLIPAGYYNEVEQLIKDGYTIEKAIEQVTMKDVERKDQEVRDKEEADREAANQKSLNDARAAADKEAADRAAVKEQQDKDAKEADEREMKAKEDTEAKAALVAIQDRQQESRAAFERTVEATKQQEARDAVDRVVEATRQQDAREAAERAAETGTESTGTKGISNASTNTGAFSAGYGSQGQHA
jgi:hypothetical protein